jgi:hypothetical protein
MPHDVTPIPSDEAQDVLAVGRSDVTCTVLSLSARHPDGDDARYLEWHMLDHLPEQYRIPEVRSGQRWVSTPRCRKARLAGDDRFDAVDHVISYLFAEPAGLTGPGLAAFFALGPRLHEAGRMPIALPRVYFGIWDVAARLANPRALAGADVVPWRPNRGAYLIVERPADRPAGWEDPAPALAALGGVAGLWRFRGAAGHPYAEDCADLEATLCYLDGDPVDEVAPGVTRVLAAGGPTPSLLLAAPFETVTPYAWDRAVP